MLTLRKTWQLIDSAPENTTVIICDIGVEAISIAHRVGGIWWLGEAELEWDIVVDFQPVGWLPANYPRNPFRAPKCANWPNRFARCRAEAA